MTIQIIRRLEIDAGHRVYQHESKCAHLHGHRYVFMLTVEPVDGELDRLGRVIDFSVVKLVVGSWLDNHWDHAMILNRRDPVLQSYRSDPVFRSQRHYAVPFNPTAENLGAYLLVLGNALLEAYAVETKTPAVRMTTVTVYETPNCHAVVDRESAERILGVAGEGDDEHGE